MRGLALLIATMMGIGRIPFAPGTAASLAVFLVFFPLRECFFLKWSLVAGLIVVGVWASGEAEKALGLRDPSSVVIDEAAGMALVMAFFPQAGWITLVSGLLLFRIFDILKPFPIRNLEKFPAGWGIVADDLGAAFYALAVLKLAKAALPGWL